jgi:hypothetical protein
MCSSYLHIHAHTRTNIFFFYVYRTGEKKKCKSICDDCIQMTNKVCVMCVPFALPHALFFYNRKNINEVELRRTLISIYKQVYFCYISNKEFIKTKKKQTIVFIYVFLILRFQLFSFLRCNKY